LGDRGAAPETMSRTLPPVNCLIFEKISRSQSVDESPPESKFEHNCHFFLFILVCDLKYFKRKHTIRFEKIELSMISVVKERTFEKAAFFDSCHDSVINSIENLKEL
jgi:hypothetical protein